jgi:hypothetical protein
MYRYETGAPARGPADLKTGNAQPVNRYFAPFPVATGLEGLPAPAPAGSAAVSGAIIAAGLNVLPQPLINKALKATLAESRLDDKSLAYETWHQFGCRFSESRLEELLISMVGNGFVSIVRDASVEDQGLTNNDPRGET